MKTLILQQGTNFSRDWAETVIKIDLDGTKGTVNVGADIAGESWYDGSKEGFEAGVEKGDHFEIVASNKEEMKDKVLNIAYDKRIEDDILDFIEDNF